MIYYTILPGQVHQGPSEWKWRKNWDLNRPQEIYFPEVTAENSITLEELKDEYKDGFNLFEGNRLMLIEAKGIRSITKSQGG